MKLRALILPLLLLLAVSFSAAQDPAPPATGAPVLAGCKVFSDDNIWNTPVDRLPLDLHSADWVRSIGADMPVHEDFSSMPINIVPSTVPRYTVKAGTPEHDPGPYPISDQIMQEGGSDQHLLILEKDNCVLYEIFQAKKDKSGWKAGGGAIFDLKSNKLRRDGWTSSDAAGLPILPGLVRWEEVAAGSIRHALRFSAPRTQRAYVWPARHYASPETDPRLPPMGARFRLKASFNDRGFSPEMLVIVKAMKKYGIILADNGGPWFVTGEPSTHWRNEQIVDELRRIKGSDFEAVDASVLMIDPNSAEAKQDFRPPQASVGAAGGGGGPLLIRIGSVLLNMNLIAYVQIDEANKTARLFSAQGRISLSPEEEKQAYLAITSPEMAELVKILPDKN